MVGLIAHVDTSPDAPGAGVEPIVHRDHDGSPIELPRDGTVVEAPAGHDVVTSSGDTLLGADDKAGVAEIMTAVAHLAAHPDLPRPTLRVCFTPDEEVGEGATLFDVERFGAVCAYTLDGSDLGELQDETFSAEERDRHDPWRRRASRVGEGHARQRDPDRRRDRRRAPGRAHARNGPTGRDGFIHVYELEGGSGTVRAARDHARLRRREAAGAQRARADHRRGDRRPLPGRARRGRDRAAVPEHAHLPQGLPAGGRRRRRRRSRAEGIEVVRTPIRGGTDGSRLSAMGLPTPNLFTGGHDYHSPREWASVQEMAAAAATVVRLAEVWARDGAPPPR